ncbi:hypothetical protein AB2L27_17140 [Kineococcus sp. LSe6-4]|uniref:Uncharacterized protein n=1 Tax=Kineococcus halophytocola TaxID=3234027 RepID=A0ABV4H4I2_9ACTN
MISPVPPGDRSTPEDVRRVVALLQRRWRVLGVPRALRDAVARDVSADLHDAHRQGRTPESVLGTSVPDVATEVARENGWLVAWPMYGRVLVAAGVGAVMALAAGLVLLLPLAAWTVSAVPAVLGWAGVTVGADGDPSWYLPIVLGAYVVFGVAFVAVVLACVRWALRSAAGLNRTLRAGVLGLPASAALSLPVAVWIGHVSGFSTAPHVVLTECGLVLGAAAVALVAARAWAVRPL